LNLLTHNFIKLSKILVGILPTKLREKFKKNDYLLAKYSSLIRTIGYFPGSISKLDRHKQYLVNLQHQKCKISSVNYNPLTNNLNLVVLLDDKSCELITQLFDSISNLKHGFSSYIIFTHEGLIERIRLRVLELKVHVGLDIHVVSNLYGFSGEFFAIRGNDRFHPSLVKCISYFKPVRADIAYVDTDEYVIKDSARSTPKFFPDWNPELQLTTDYVKTGVWGRDITDLLNPRCTLKSSFGGITNWLTQTYLLNRNLKVAHIPLTLVHTIENGVCDSKLSKECSKIISSSYKCHVTEHFDYRALSFSSLDTSPLVSIIIPTRNGKALVKQCVDSIYAKTSYSNFEILLIDNDSDDSESIDYFNQIEESGLVQILHYKGEFNYSAINNFAVQNSRGDVITLLNNDIEVITGGWLDNMVALALMEGVGAVGAKLLYPDNTIQHAGVVLGYGGGAGHAHKYFPSMEKGYLNRIAASNCYTAVTAACLVVTKDNYNSVNGLNESDLAVAFNDVDFCLKLHHSGKRNIYCAEAVLYHHESVSRGLDNTEAKRIRFLSELKYLKHTWYQYIENDLNYNLNLTNERENFSISKKDRISALSCERRNG
tara:strand:+ start:10500 stop:12299 length:1800 start_codon:yes stop_codon:yes gene_type:complete